MSFDNPDGSAVKTGAKVSVIALVLIAALYFGFLRDNAEGQPDTAESAAPYVCVECQHAFTITPAEYERLSKSGGLKTVQAGEGERRGQTRFLCPECGKFGGVSAMLCPNDGTSVPSKYVNGQAPKCPKCGWTP